MKHPVALVAYRAFSDLAGKGAFLLLTVLAARRLSQEGFGIFALGTTVGWVAAVTTDFGIQLHLARAVARQPTDAERLLRVWLHVRLRTAAMALVAVAIGLAAAGSANRVGFAILLFTLVYVVSSLIEFLHYFYRGLSRSDVESSLVLWQRFGTLGCGAVALAARPDVMALAAAMVLPVLVTFLYSAQRAGQLARQAATARSGGNGTVPPFDRFRLLTPPAGTSVGGELWRDVAPIGAGIVLSALYFRVDIFLIQLWKGTESVALYNPVFRLVEALLLFPAAVLGVALPRLCRATSARPLLQLSAAVTAFALVVTSILWIGAGWLVPFVYGAPYAQAVPAFRILLLSFPLMSLNCALTHQLIGWNGHRAYAGLCAAALVLNVALNARLIPALSIVGAAWSTLWTEVLLTLGCLSILWLGSRYNTGLLDPPQARLFDSPATRVTDAPL